MAAHVAVVAAYRDQHRITSDDPRQVLGPYVEAGHAAHKAYWHAAESVLAARRLAGLDHARHANSPAAPARAQHAADVYRNLPEPDRAAISSEMAERLGDLWFGNPVAPDEDAATQPVHAPALTATLVRRGHLATATQPQPGSSRKSRWKPPSPGAPGRHRRIQTAHAIALPSRLRRDSLTRSHAPPLPRHRARHARTGNRRMPTPSSATRLGGTNTRRKRASISATAEAMNPHTHASLAASSKWICPSIPISSSEDEHLNVVVGHYVSARRMLAGALQAEVDAYIAAHAAERGEDGRRLVVRDGYHQPREVLASAGAAEVTVPRVNDKRTGPATGERKRFSSAILPPWARKTRRSPGYCRCCTCMACPARTSGPRSAISWAPRPGCRRR